MFEFQSGFSLFISGTECFLSQLPLSSISLSVYMFWFSSNMRFWQWCPQHAASFQTPGLNVFSPSNTWTRSLLTDLWSAPLGWGCLLFSHLLTIRPRERLHCSLPNTSAPPCGRIIKHNLFLGCHLKLVAL